jgi:WD40 repeat protein
LLAFSKALIYHGIEITNKGDTKTMTINKRRTAVVLLVGLGMLSAGGLLLGQSARSAPQSADAAKAGQAKKDAVDDKAIRNLITQLGDDSFEKREAAEKKLAEIGEPALELLHQAAKDAGDAEIRQRAAELARTITSSYMKLVRSFTWPTKVGGNPTGTSRVVVTADGKKIIAGNSDALRCWDIESGQELLLFKETKGVIWALAFSPDGRRLISAGGDRMARLFDLETGKKLQEFQGHADAVWGAVVLPGGKEVLTGSWDQTLRVWDVETGKQVRTFEGVLDKVRCLVVSPDGKTVAAGHFTETPDKVRAGTVRIWDIESGREIRAMPGHAAEVAAIAYSADGKMLASSGYDKTLRLWDVAAGKELQRLTGSTPHYVEYAVFTPDCKRVVSCGTEGEGTNFAVRNWTVRVWDVASGKQLLESERIRGGVLCVDVLPDSHRCVTASRDGIVRLWEWKK